ncbi:two-component regulator propeller domain-containing protein [Dyadobacter sp. CY312]|uniref:ligand-binding sensor domain-containing protein n=1 Tax=Dyadobacter sp. CY312 TaxID=2907303 RepID=UPI001F43DA93|nr:two-component regulator propeller domain-containing protein [Dyadobacter sp. CY312]MCE7042399.1 histidine kinase [Dyadobacter sp. CY312]
MTKLLHVCGLLIIVFCSSCGQNQTDTVKDNQKFATKDSVISYRPNAMVRNVKQDRNGNILLAASLAGVFRYAGNSFTNLTSKLGPLRYWDVLEDRRGNIWVATTDSGVYYYPSAAAATTSAGSKSFQHFTTREGLASNSVMSIYEDKAGIIWLGTGGGVSRYDPRRAVPRRTVAQRAGNYFQNFTTKDGLPNNSITTIMEDKTGKLWIGSRGEACFYDPSSARRSDPLGAGGKTFTVFKNKDGKAFNNVWGFTEDKKGNIWFSATIIEDKKGDRLVVKAGLWRYDPSLGTGGSAFIKINDKGTSAIIEDKKGNIWTTGAVHPNGVGAWKLLRYDQKSLYNEKPIVTEIMSIDQMLCGILEAEDGSIWFGSLSGVYRYDGKKITDFKDNKDKEKQK